MEGAKLIRVRHEGRSEVVTLYPGLPRKELSRLLRAVFGLGKR